MLGIIWLTFTGEILARQSFQRLVVKNEISDQICVNILFNVIYVNPSSYIFVIMFLLMFIINVQIYQLLLN